MAILLLASCWTGGSLLLLATGAIWRKKSEIASISTLSVLKQMGIAILKFLIKSIKLYINLMFKACCASIKIFSLSQLCNTLQVSTKNS